MTLTLPGVTEDTEIFTVLDWEPETPCEWSECTNAADWWITCPCGTGKETCCNFHRQYLIDLVSITFLAAVRFSNSCQHNPLVMDCIWTPLNT